MHRSSLLVYSAAALTALGLGLSTVRGAPDSAPDGAPALARSSTPIAGIGSAEALYERYLDWKREVELADPGQRFVFGLNYLRGVSSGYTEARGLVSIDLQSGEVTARLEGLPLGSQLELWLVDDRGAEGGTPQFEPQDERLLVGSFHHEGNGAELEQRLSAGDARGFEIDRVVVAARGRELEQGALLFGGPTLFQRLYALERSRAAERSATSALLGLAAPIQLGGPLGSGPLSALVSQGEDLFFNEQFKGNGRTCGTCHPIENNLTIDPDFIAKLPNTDPLFVAEFVPALNHMLNGGQRFENPVLMRKFALITENLDGFSNLGKIFTMRGVPHVFAQGISIQAGNGVTPPDERTGWSGDGAPSGIVNGIFTSGRLFDFPVGAVIQHFPRTTGRVNNVDFRMPTNAELVAMEAFQLSLGRQTDFDLNTLSLNDPDADTGRVLFRQSSCNKCHPDAGAGQPNFNFDTGVEEFLINNPDGTGEPRPADGGFGTDPAGLFPSIPVANTGSDPNKPMGSFGNGEFNTPSIVEAADSAAFFHNNVVDGSIEDAIDFYRSSEFIQAQGFAVSFPGNGREQVGKFLRAINSMDNIDSSVFYAKRAHDATAPSGTSVIDPAHHEAVNLFLRFSIADIDDCLRVLGEVALNPVAQEHLRMAKCFFLEAMAPNKWNKRRDLIAQGIDELNLARVDIGT